MARIIIDFVLPSAYGFVLLLNIDSVKGVVLFIIAVLYGIARLIFYVIKQNQERRMKELDIKERKMKLQKHEI